MRILLKFYLVLLSLVACACSDTIITQYISQPISKEEFEVSEFIFPKSIHPNLKSFREVILFDSLNIICSYSTNKTTSPAQMVLIKSSDGGKSWVEIDRDSVFGFSYRFKKLDKNEAYINTNFSKNFHVFEKGNRIEKKDYLPSLTAYIFFNNKEGYNYNNDILYRTTDGGYNIEELSFVDSFGKSRRCGFAFYDINNGIAFTKNEPLYQSKFSIFNTYNGGRSWKKETEVEYNFALMTITDLKFVNSNYGYAREGYLSSFIRTNDGGRNWYPVQLLATKDSISESYFKVEHFEAFDNYVIISTTNYSDAMRDKGNLHFHISNDYGFNFQYVGSVFVDYSKNLNPKLEVINKDLFYYKMDEKVIIFKRKN